MKENIIEKEWKCSAQKKYYYKNREELALKDKIYKANNPEKVKQWKRNYYKNNKEKVALYQKEWKAKQPPVVKPVKHCNWCLQPLGKNRSKFCSDTCNDKFKIYEKRMGPIWMWRLYSKYKIYKIFYQYIPKIKNLFVKKIPKFFIKIFLKFKNKLKKLNANLRYFNYRFHKAKICGHWRLHRHDTRYEYKNTRNFCSDKCKQIHDQKIAEAKKQRNLTAWGTEHRPDAETRKRIIAEKRRAWEDNKKKTDPAFKLLKRMRVRTRKVLKGIYKEGKNWIGKKLSIFEKLGIKSGQELRDHIEAQWQEGMNWNNYGSGKGFWVVDHDTPIAYYKNNFDLLNDLEIQKKCFGKENLKPMWWVDNAHKAAKLNYNEFE